MYVSFVFVELASSVDVYSRAAVFLLLLGLYSKIRIRRKARQLVTFLFRFLSSGTVIFMITAIVGRGARGGGSGPLARDGQAQSTNRGSTERSGDRGGKVRLAGRVYMAAVQHCPASRRLFLICAVSCVSSWLWRATHK